MTLSDTLVCQIAASQKQLNPISPIANSCCNCDQSARSQPKGNDDAARSN
jgi:hypothetical protein